MRFSLIQLAASASSSNCFLTSGFFERYENAQLITLAVVSCPLKIKVKTSSRM